MMSRRTIVFLALTIVLIFSGCKIQSEKNVEEVSSTLSILSPTSIEKDNTSSSSIISGSEPAPSSTLKTTYSMSGGGGDKQLLADLSSSAYKDVIYEVSDRLHKDMPEYRFVAKGVTRSTEDYGIGFVMGMEVFDDKGHLFLSVDFSDTAGDEILGSPVYNEMMDTMGVNFDGCKDVIILNDFSGAHGNTWYSCWLWNPKTSSFVESRSFAEICNPALDPQNKCIYSAGGSGAEYWGGSIYKYIDGEFIMTNNLDADSGGLTETELENGKMVVVRKVSYDSGDKSEDAERQYYIENGLWQLGNPRWYMVGGHEADKWLDSK